MICKLGLGLLLSTTLVWAQPQGPWVVMEADTNLKWPLIVSCTDTSLKFIHVYEGTDSHRVAATTFDLQTHSVSGEEAVVAYPLAWKTILADAEISYNGCWSVAVDRKWGPHEEIYILLYSGTSVTNNLLDQASWWTYGYCQVIEWFQELKVSRMSLGWSWSVAAGHTNPFECFAVISPYLGITDLESPQGQKGLWDYQILTGTIPTYFNLTWGNNDRGYALITSDNFANYPAGSYLITSSDTGICDLPPIGLDHVLHTFTSDVNAEGELLAVTGISPSFSAPSIGWINGSGNYQERASIPWADDPTDVVWRSNYGFAVIQQGSSDLRLFRANSNGELHLDDGIFYSSDTSHTIISSDVQIGNNGTVFVLWKENSIQPPYLTTIRLLWTDWNTPLSANPPPERTVVRRYTLNTYPNPFNSELQIRYDMPRAGKVELSVYNVLGQKVATILQGMQSAGSHEAVWSPKESSGIYFVTLRTAESARTEKVLLAR